MNLYYFHIRDGHTILDEVDSLLPNIAAVKKEALKITSELIGSPRSAHWDATSWRLWVTEGANGEGKTLLTLDVLAQAVA
jgi:hypothetical protein